MAVDGFRLLTGPRLRSGYGLEFMIGQNARWKTRLSFPTPARRQPEATSHEGHLDKRVAWGRGWGSFRIASITAWVRWAGGVCFRDMIQLSRSCLEEVGMIQIRLMLALRKSRARLTRDLMVPTVVDSIRAASA